MKKIVLFLIFSCSLCAKTDHFQQVQQLVQDLPEGVEPDNSDFEDPEFDSFHKKNMPNMVFRFFKRIGADHSFFSVAKLRILLRSLAQQREDAGKKGRFVQALAPQPGSRFFVWGDVHAAFHSLIRGLHALLEQGVIDNQLNIVQPNAFLVFNGNVINRTPYSLETLYLIMLLMEKNPNNVIYIQGTHEDRQWWLSYSFADDLKIRARHASREVVPLQKHVTRFFNTLPLALYLTHVGDQHTDAIRISNRGRDFVELNEISFAKQLNEVHNELAIIDIEKGEKSEKPIFINAIITSEDRLLRYKKTSGLHIGGTQQESTPWVVLSSPIYVHQKLYEFYHDAFAKLVIANPFEHSIISLYNRDTRQTEPFELSNTFNVFTAQPVDPNKVPLDGKAESIPQVVFGATMDLSKSTSPIGIHVNEGLRMRFAQEVADGGVHGLIPRLITFDDEYTPNKTRHAVERLLQDFGVDLLIGSQGSPSLESYLDLVKDKKVLVLFPFTGAPVFRDKNLSYVIHGARVSYEHEGRILAEYAVNELKAKRFVLFYQNDAFGYGPRDSALKELNRLGISNILQVPYERNDVSFELQSKQIRSFNPDAILFLSTATAAKGLIRQMGVQFFSGRKLLGLSVYEDAFERFLDTIGLHFVLMRMVPNPRESSLRIVQEYREQAKKMGIEPDKLSLEMYINASILFEILSKVEGPITKEKIITIAQNMKKVDFKGIILDFNPETRELSRTVWLDPGDGRRWIEYDVRQKME